MERNEPQSMGGTRPAPSSPASYDLIMVGGGLQNGLIALACLTRACGLRVALIERERSLGGNHTWAFHAQDVPAAARSFVEGLIAHRWTGYDVRFHNLRRTLRGPYAAITSPRFASVLETAFARSPSSTVRLGCPVAAVHGDHVVLADGERIRAPLVIDARGPDPDAAGADCGFQKFLGLEIDFAREHGVTRPILMDATVPQTDGFRFFYVLPMAARRLLIEDTAFSRSPELAPERTRASVLAYAAQFGRVESVGRVETGVLPMPWAASRPPPLTSPLAAGYRGGWFHPATGYSFPIAIRLACHVAAHAPRDVLGPGLAALRRTHRRQARYAEQLNRLLFTAFPPDAMWNVFERFYRLPEALIHRFYALSLTPLDRARILIGRPPHGFSLIRAFSGAS